MCTLAVEKEYTYSEFGQAISNGLGKIPDTKFFNHYTKLSTVKKIFSNKFWYISSFQSMNDLAEAERYGDEKSSTFAMCFSCGEAERIPMWYMYAGIDGKGAMISFTKNAFSDFIKQIETVYPVKNDKPDLNMPLIRGKDFEIEYGYVYYCNFDNDRITNIKYKRSNYKISDSQEAELKFREDNFFIKNNEWEYENEYRIVFKMLTPLQDGVEKLAVKLTDSLEDVSLTEGPEFSPNSDSFPEELMKKFLGRIKKSTLKIKMDMLSRNKKSFFDLPVESFERTEIEKMCKNIQDAKRCPLSVKRPGDIKELSHV